MHGNYYHDNCFQVTLFKDCSAEKQIEKRRKMKILQFEKLAFALKR
jgi:hypothetical protein